MNNNCGCTPNPCNQPVCGCPVYISSDCVNDVLAEFPNLNIASHLTLTETLELMDEAIYNMVNTITSYLTIANVGGEVEVYKGMSGTGVKQFRTLESSINLLTITQNTDTISFNIDTALLDAFVKAHQLTTTLETTLAGISLLKDPIVVGNNTEYPVREVALTSAGTGEPIIRNINTTDDDLVDFKFKSLSSSSLEITSTADEVFIELPVDESARYFYVNENYTGVDQTGSIAKPYKTLVGAINAFIGTGTYLEPEFGGVAKIILLSNCSIDHTDTINTKSGNADLSINRLTIESDGEAKLLFLEGADKYWINTESLISAAQVAESTDNTMPLPYDIYVIFNNVKLISTQGNKIINHLNYRSSVGSTTPQPTSAITLTNCQLINGTSVATYNSQIPGTFTPISGVFLFGVQVYTQNTLPVTNYMTVIKNLSWTGESNANISSCRFEYATSAAIYFENTRSSIVDVNFVANPYNLSHQTLSTRYIGRTGFFDIIAKDSDFIRFENMRFDGAYATHASTILGGGVQGVVKNDNSKVYIEKGFVYGRGVESIAHIDSTTTHEMQITNSDFTNLFSYDTVGAFKLISTPTTGKIAWLEGSSVRDVKFTNVSGEIVPSAFNATVNGAMFTSFTQFSYADDTAAKAAGLILGNFYINTTTNVLTRIET